MVDTAFAHITPGYLSQVDGLSPERSLGELGEEVDPNDEKIRAMLLDWGQRVETWQKTKLIADRAMGSFVADKVRMLLSRKMCGADTSILDS